jgi:hypothetical protein
MEGRRTLMNIKSIKKSQNNSINPVAGAVVGAGMAVAGAMLLKDEKNREKVKDLLENAKGQATQHLEKLQSKANEKKGEVKTKAIEGKKTVKNKAAKVKKSPKSK